MPEAKVVPGEVLFDTYLPTICGGVEELGGDGRESVLEQGSFDFASICSEVEFAGNISKAAKANVAGWEGPTSFIYLAVNDELVSFEGELAGDPVAIIVRHFPTECYLSPIWVTMEEADVCSGCFGELVDWET